ncbi:hypothetical protein HY932_01055 [Candidatus Falkowbacteria bacterium]|nr:hypothetical protein [Candidatus Falkowbacteria bacterium]
MTVAQKTVCIVVVCLALASPALAADDFWSSIQSEVPAGILPDSFWYWTDVVAERVRMFLTLKKEAKVNYLLGVADEKIAEAQAMVMDELPDEVDSALAQYDYNIAKAMQVFSDAVEDGKIFAQTTQDRLETAILLHEKMVQLSILKIPEQTMMGMNAIYNAISSWFNQLLDHLKWKRSQIDVKKASLMD